MKPVLGAILSVWLLAASNLVMASPWDEYSEFMNQFYYLDKQNFNNISCDVEVSTISNNLAQLRAQLKPLEDRIKIVENLSDFRISFTRENGLEISMPSFDVKLISEEGIADRERVEAGIQMMKDGMRYQIDGAAQTIEGLFEEYSSPREGSINIKKMTREKDGVHILYEKDGAEVTKIYSGNTLKLSAIDSMHEVRSEETFEKAGGKLIVKSATAQVKQGPNTIGHDMSVEYQSIRSVVFPAKVTSRSTIITQDARQEGLFDIRFVNCRVD